MAGSSRFSSPPSRARGDTIRVENNFCDVENREIGEYLLFLVLIERFDYIVVDSFLETR